MTQESTSSFEKIRDEALQAFIARMRLTPQQISALKLSQVHLATSSLVIEPDEFTSAAGAAERPVVLNLDGETQRAIVAWLVVRPDGPNNHLFPGADLEPIDLATIEHVAAAVAAQRLAEPPPPSPAGAWAPEPTAAQQAPQAQPPGAAALDEIEALRKELAAAEEDWSHITGPEAAINTQDRSVVEERHVPEATPPRPRMVQRPSVAPPSSRLPRDASTVRPRAPRATATAEERAPEPARRTPLQSPAGYEERRTIAVPYPILAVAAAILVLACCASLASIGVLVLGREGVESLVAGIIPLGTGTATTTPTSVARATPIAAATPTVAPSPTFTAMPAPTDTPQATPSPTERPRLAAPQSPLPTPTPIIIVVTATPMPEPPPTARPPATDTPAPAGSPVPTETLTATYKYAAPVLLEPANNERVQGRMRFLKWQSVGNLADDEWYAVRLIYMQQGKPVYQGDDVKAIDWQVPERFYYQADGPALEYRWHVYVERKNPDGSATQLSPDSGEFVFKWE